MHARGKKAHLDPWAGDPLVDLLLIGAKGFYAAAHKCPVSLIHEERLEGHPNIYMSMALLSQDIQAFQCSCNEKIRFCKPPALLTRQTMDC